MSEAAFSQQVDQLFYQFEEALDDSGADVDYESSGGLLTITCERDGSQIILSRQPALQQIWLAAKSGGFHFVEQQGQWRCTLDQRTLQQYLSDALLAQAGEEVEFPEQ